ncbi:hypothetical protein BCV72DRAFT_332415 [Rhizopus microsporus var. microsporus]|uniref:Uncharacterized protein n=1 Tax=Rhizopus microsporus var. microsporus TaxID=86635 RepID=A0A1X0RGF3_RHIZD|nr:hypothetical protein BCV72DRAFT_332415 [Rhizopus microsporus var. microsporus]
MVDNPFIPKNINQALIYQDDNDYNRQYTYNNHHVELIDADERFVQMLPVSNGYTNQPNAEYNNVNPYLSNIYQDILPTEEIQVINQTRKQKKDDLFFDDGTNSLIDEALDRLMPYSISNNKDSLRSLIDELKYKEPSKNSTKYQILNAVETILSLWKSASPKSEYTYLRKFESLLEIILDDAELIMSDGESICASTRDCLRSSLKEVDEEMTKFGRRIDLLIKCSRLDTSAELCSIEFKKNDASNTDIIHQQSKNARVNVCILNSLNCFTNAFDNQVLSVDFVGTNGYMTQMFWCKEVIVTQKVCSLSIPTDVYDLGSLRNTLKYLYLWKKHLLVLSAKVIQSLHCNKRKYSLIETCEEDSSPRQCTPDMQLADVFMTPHRRTKK